MAGHIMEMRDEIPPEKLPPPVRISGIGNAHMEITATPEAQMWFDQGLNLLHDFWDYESARAFEQGVRVDPQCAMCYWGLYKAESFYHSTAQGQAGQALAQAVALKEHGANSSARNAVKASAFSVLFSDSGSLRLGPSTHLLPRLHESLDGARRGTLSPSSLY